MSPGGVATALALALAVGAALIARPNGTRTGFVSCFKCGGSRAPARPAPRAEAPAGGPDDNGE